MVMASLENPAARQKTENRKREPTNIDFRPNMSATLPKNRRKAPLLSELADEIQVICAVVIIRLLELLVYTFCNSFALTNSRTTKDEMTVTEPAKKLVMPIAMVAVNTKRTSCAVFLKHAGRTLFVWTGSMAAISSMPSPPTLGIALLVVGALFSSSLEPGIADGQRTVYIDTSDIEERCCR